MMVRAKPYTVTGPGVEHPFPDGPNVALSAAITFASHASRAREEVTFYVRDPQGNAVGYAASDVDGCVAVRRGWIAGERG